MDGKISLVAKPMTAIRIHLARVSVVPETALVKGASRKGEEWVAQNGQLVGCV